MKTVLFFTADAIPTAEETAKIAEFNELAEARFRILVANGKANAKYGEVNRLIPCDFVYGGTPSEYSELPVFDPSAEGGKFLPTQAIVNDGDTFTVADKQFKATVTNNVIVLSEVVA